MSNVNLMQASQEWADRPADERFSTPEELLQAVTERKARAATATVPFSLLQAQATGDRGLLLVGPAGVPAALSDWSFGQVCGRIGAPKSYLQTLPAPKAADLVNYGISQGEGAGKMAALLLDNRDGATRIRSFNSELYERLWDEALASRLCTLQAEGWRVPPARPAFPNQPGSRPATEADVLRSRDGGGGLSISIGDMIAPAGLYAGDRDMFAFMVNEAARIEDGTDQGLSRGFFLQNSEVGASSVKITAFLYRHVCGNHIVWGAEAVRRLAIRHVGDGPDRFFRELRVRLTEYTAEGAAEDRLRVKKAQAFTLAAKKDEVIDLLFKAAILSRRKLTTAYDLAEAENENPTTAWGFAQGITRLSQAAPFAGERADMDKAAGKVLEMAF
jgi:hypothetical protein